MDESRYETGMRVRRAVLGESMWTRAQARQTAFDADFQRFITEVAWGSVWARPDLDRRTRSLITIAILAALGRTEELAPAPAGQPEHRRDAAGDRRSAAACGGVCGRARREHRLCHRQNSAGDGLKRRRSRRKQRMITTIGEIVRGDRAVFPPYLYEAYRRRCGARRPCRWSRCR